MYNNYQNMPMNYRPNRPNPPRPNPPRPNLGYPNDDRFIGGFAFPFLLGGVTGAALAPNFYRPNYRPYPYPVPYPYYPPYYRPY